MNTSGDMEIALIKLFTLMLSANVLKGLIYLYDSWVRLDGEGTGRSIRLIITSAILIIVIRNFHRHLRIFVHYAVITTILHIYYRAFNQDVGMDVVAIQAIFMVIISSFYAIGRKWGTFYSGIAVICFIAVEIIPFRVHVLQALPSNLNNIYILINWIVIILSHHYFHKILFDSLNNSQEMTMQNIFLAESRSKFLATISHEIRTPLNSLIGISNLLKIDQNDKNQSELLKTLQISSKTLLSLINNVLDLNKLEAGQVQIEQTNFRIAPLIQQITSQMRYKANSKGISMQASIQPQLDNLTVKGDPTRLTQIVTNLLDNAIKFTHKGNVTISVCEIERSSYYVLLDFEISDSGIGMTQQQQQTIFNPFEQADASVNRKYGGTGLGLSIVDQLLKMMNSQIFVSSKLGEGTRMSFKLPFAIVSEAEEIPVIESHPINVEVQQLKILLAEDNDLNIFYMKHLFAQWEISADIAANGMEVISLIKGNDYDVILMDISMPIMNGIETAIEIRKMDDINKSNVFIIALTASNSPDIIHQAMGAGINELITKPFEPNILINKLGELSGIFGSKSKFN